MLHVKREVVSVRDAVEVITQSTDYHRLDRTFSQKAVSPSCRKCLKERSRDKSKYRLKASKSNTPIVIQLKDTLKAALRQKQRSLDDVKVRQETLKTENVSVEDVKVRQQTLSLKQTKTKKHVKNLSALISVIEKSNEKERFSVSNFTKNAKNGNSKFQRGYVLNNYTECDYKPRSILGCRNVDIICNDLNGSENTEETDSEDSSTISSSEIQSDSDVSVTNQENVEFEMAPDELEQLALYTTGCPLIRYDCPPSQCPHCLTEGYSQPYFYNYSSGNYEVHNQTECQSVHGENLGQSLEITHNKNELLLEKSKTAVHSDSLERHDENISSKIDSHEGVNDESSSEVSHQYNSSETLLQSNDSIITERTDLEIIPQSFHHNDHHITSPRHLCHNDSSETSHHNIHTSSFQESFEERTLDHNEYTKHSVYKEQDNVDRPSNENLIQVSETDGKIKTFDSTDCEVKTFDEINCKVKTSDDNESQVQTSDDKDNENKTADDSDHEEVSVSSESKTNSKPDSKSDLSLHVNAQCFKSRNPQSHVFQRKDTHQQRQLLDIDIARSADNLDSVYIDLTDTDVTFTVYYHHDYTQHTSDNYATNYYTKLLQPDSYLPHWYWSYPYTLPTTILAPSDSDYLPKTLMVPPQELQKFNSTQPPNRQWVWLSNPDRSRSTAIFTVMCYNVLCDKYCTRQLYGYCPSWALNWEYRKKGIMEEIKHCSADIICLQEVETDQFYNFFLPDLKRDGYDGIFSAKSRARTMTESERKYVDGCAIFFKTSKFTLVKEHLIEFNQLAMASAEGCDDMLNRVMTKDNIGLAAMLETKQGVFDNGLPPENLIRQQVMVATAHIHWDPEFCDVKLIQTMMLMSELKNIIEESVRTFRPGSGPPDINSIPLILCGDLNSLPDSGVLEFLISGKVSRNHEDFKDRGYDDCLQRLSCNADKDNHTNDFRLLQAYNSDVMPFTNYTFDFKGIIDYIFYSRDHLNLLGILGPLDEEWFRQNKVVGCPHPHVPSDHFPLFVEYEMPVPQPDGTRQVNTASQTKNR